MNSTNDTITELCEAVVKQFKQITRNYALFHLAFFALAVSEALAFLLFFSFFAKSSLLAFAIAAFFLTGFSYFVLLFYFQAKKPEQISQLREDFLEKCEQTFLHQDSNPTLHLSQALARLSQHFQHVEYNYYPLPAPLSTLKPLMQKFSVWAHWKDLHTMKEALHLSAIRQHLELVKKAPVDVECHATLATAYLRAAQLYHNPVQSEENAVLWTPPDYHSSDMHQKFVKFAENALEEFKIIDALSNNDKWVQAQIASLYGDLQRPEEQIRAYEKLLALSSQDEEVMLRLGTLYFQQGQSSQALRLYEQLQALHSAKAEELISHYGAHL